MLLLELGKQRWSKLPLPLQTQAYPLYPVGKHGTDDKLVWRYEPLGEFSVKSAYKLLYTTPISNSLQTSTTSFYRKLWNLDIPLKKKITIWRIAHGYIPTKENMFRWHLVLEAICPRCGNGTASSCLSQLPYHNGDMGFNKIAVGHFYTNTREFGMAHLGILAWVVIPNSAFQLLLVDSVE